MANAETLCAQGPDSAAQPSEGYAVNMQTELQNKWQQVLARDARQDGRFVFAVRTTGVFCRPSCPSRRPRRDSVEFFAGPREAERAGYRACLRCKPTRFPSRRSMYCGRGNCSTTLKESSRWRSSASGSDSVHSICSGCSSAPPASARASISPLGACSTSKPDYAKEKM